MINGKSSNWRDLISGVPSRSVIGPTLFLIYVNDIDEGLTCEISKFADDTKITTRVTTTADKLQLQSNLDILVSWSNKWQIKFNVDICKFCISELIIKRQIIQGMAPNFQKIAMKRVGVNY